MLFLLAVVLMLVALSCRRRALRARDRKEMINTVVAVCRTFPVEDLATLAEKHVLPCGCRAHSGRVFVCAAHDALLEAQ